MIETLVQFGNWLSAPVPITTVSIVLFVIGLRYYRFFTRPPVALTLAGAGIVIFSVCMFHPHFFSLMTEPRHVPAVAVLALFFFFTWLALRKAAINDQYIEQGLEIPAKSEAEKDVLTWPDLVFTEFISTIFVSVILMVWALTLHAPLEEPANATTSPNPAKAPWYFLGLQELLVYYDPWIAGVIIPTLIIVGLMAIPYIDRNPKGNGYYTFSQRPLAVSFNLFGWWILWHLLIFRGTFLRGPNWAHFGIFEQWSTKKATGSLNLTFSDMIWVDFLQTTPPETGINIPLGLMSLPVDPFIRESFGFVVLAAYFVLPTLWLAKTWLRSLYVKLGLIRYSLLIFFLLTTFAIPLKMYLRWLFSFKYLIEIQSLYFNI
jgi:hypothetical protein